MPGICRYPAKCTGHAVNQGGTADSVVRLDHVLYSSLTDSIILSGAFFYWDSFDRSSVKRSILF